MITDQHHAHASASTLATPTVLVHLPARVPLDAPATPLDPVNIRQRAISSMLMLSLVLIWFFR